MGDLDRIRELPYRPALRAHNRPDRWQHPIKRQSFEIRLALKGASTDGKLALVELLNARRALTEARTQTIEAATERLSAQAALARLAGVAPFGDQP